MTIASAADMQSAAAYFLEKRSFKGMDMNTEDMETGIIKGRSGRAAEYEGERRPDVG